MVLAALILLISFSAACCSFCFFPSPLFANKAPICQWAGPPGLLAQNQPNLLRCCPAYMSMRLMARPAWRGLCRGSWHHGPDGAAHGTTALLARPCWRGPVGAALLARPCWRSPLGAASLAGACWRGPLAQLLARPSWRGPLGAARLARLTAHGAALLARLMARPSLLHAPLAGRAAPCRGGRGARGGRECGWCGGAYIPPSPPPPPRHRALRALAALPPFIWCDIGMPAPMSSCGPEAAGHPWGPHRKTSLLDSSNRITLGRADCFHMCCAASRPWRG